MLPLGECTPLCPFGETAGLAWVWRWPEITVTSGRAAFTVCVSRQGKLACESKPLEEAFWKAVLYVTDKIIWSDFACTDCYNPSADNLSRNSACWAPVKVLSAPVCCGTRVSPNISTQWGFSPGACSVRVVWHGILQDEMGSEMIWSTK